MRTLHLFSTKLKTFPIDPKSGEVSTLARLDMEAENNNLFESHSPADTPIVFNITVQNECGNVAKVPVEIFLIGKDEFAPVFVKSAFTFKVSNKRVKLFTPIIIASTTTNSGSANWPCVGH